MRKTIKKKEDATDYYNISSVTVTKEYFDRFSQLEMLLGKSKRKLTEQLIDALCEAFKQQINALGEHAFECKWSNSYIKIMATIEPATDVIVHSRPISLKKSNAELDKELFEVVEREWEEVEKNSEGLEIQEVGGD